MNNMTELSTNTDLSEEERRSGLERRSFSERRHHNGPWYGNERRRPDDRRYQNRRGLNHDVLFSTVDSFQFYEDWLDTYSRAPWHLEIVDINDQGKKVVRVLFEMEFDQINFRAMLETRRTDFLEGGLFDDDLANEGEQTPSASLNDD